MSDEPENLTLRGLRRIGEQNETILRKLDEIVTRLPAIQRDIAGMRANHATAPPVV